MPISLDRPPHLACAQIASLRFAEQTFRSIIASIRKPDNIGTRHAPVVLTTCGSSRPRRHDSREQQVLWCCAQLYIHGPIPRTRYSSTAALAKLRCACILGCRLCQRSPRERGFDIPLSPGCANPVCSPTGQEVKLKQRPTSDCGQRRTPTAHANLPNHTSTSRPFL